MIGIVGMMGISISGGPGIGGKAGIGSTGSNGEGDACRSGFWLSSRGGTDDGAIASVRISGGF